MADRRAGFAAFYAANAEPVRRALGLVLRDGSLAEEATQEAFTRAYVSWRRVGAMDRPAAWVYVVALHVAYRRRGRGVTEPAPTGTAGPDIAELVATRESVRAAIARLPERQRTAIVLRYLADLPLSDIATAMGCAVGTVKSTLHSAVLRLGVELEDDNEEIQDARG